MKRVTGTDGISKDRTDPGRCPQRSERLAVRIHAKLKFTQIQVGLLQLLLEFPVGTLQLRILGLQFLQPCHDFLQGLEGGRILIAGTRERQPVLPLAARSRKTLRSLNGIETGTNSRKPLAVPGQFPCAHHMNRMDRDSSTHEAKRHPTGHQLKERTFHGLRSGWLSPRCCGDENSAMKDA